MARKKQPFVAPSPRIWSRAQVAALFGKGEQWFRDHLHLLEAKGFPTYDDLLGGWDSAAIRRWLDRRSGLISNHGGDEAWMEALND